MSQQNTLCDSFGTIVKGGLLASDKLFRGLTYGDYLEEWVCWLHSSNPYFKGYQREILHARGNLSWYYDEEKGKRIQADEFNNQARDAKNKVFRGCVIEDNTPIFVPVMAAFYWVGETDMYSGRVLKSVVDCQEICRSHINQPMGNLWCVLQKKTEDGQPICEQELDGELIYCETTPFRLTVAEDNPFKEHFEMAIQPGNYEAFAAAKALMLNTSESSKLEKGYYRLRYGGFGAESYMDDSVLDFIVNPAKAWPRISQNQYAYPQHTGEVEDLSIS